MFGSLRLISLISLAFMVVITIVAGFSFRGTAVDYLQQQIGKSNENIVEGYVSTIWKDNEHAIASIKEKTPEQLKKDQEILIFAQKTMGYFKKMPALRVNIYSANGSLLLTSEGEKGKKLTAQPLSPNVDFVAQGLRGISPQSHIVKDVKLQDGDNGIVIQTVFPIRASENTGGVNGAVEVVSDFNEPVSTLQTAQFFASAYIIIIFLVLLFLILGIAKRAEAIISKQHEANLELAAAATAAQTESRDKSQFLANVSHELRTPLNAIIGFSEIIKNNVFGDFSKERFEGYINDIHAAGVHLLSLINDILDYSKAEAGKLELEVSEVNANKLVHNCVRLVTPRAENAAVNLIEALPKEALNLVTDSKKFKQILLNLLSNAIKFTPQGGEVRVSAWADLSGKSYIFEVKDSGIGIAPKDISRAMAPFGQVDSTLSRKYEGTGLGLPLTKKFVELMGGEFNISSEIGQGTTITFSLPQELPERDGVIVKQAM